MLAQKQKRQARVLDGIDKAFALRAKKVPFGQNLFDDAQIKKILRRRAKYMKTR